MGETNPQANWYFERDLQQQGPIPWPGLQSLASGGHIHPQTLVWTAGMPDWIAAASVEGLFNSAPALAEQQAVQPVVSAPPVQIHYQTMPAFHAEYAGFWLRFAAALIDAIVLMIPAAVLIAPLVVLAAASGSSPRIAIFFLLGQLLAQLLWLIVAWLYFALMESSSRQATLGKLVLGLRVTDKFGRRITFGRATGRYFGKILSYLPLYIGFILAAFTERKQALHDLLADTLVIVNPR